MKNVAAAAALLAALLAGPALAQAPGHGDEAEPPVELQIGGSFMLEDHRGRVVRDELFYGRHMLILFGYTYCPDVCPTGLQTMSEVMDLLGDDAAQVQPLFITVDPERDTRKVLADYVGAFHPAILGLTGPKAFVDSVIGKYRIRVAKVETPEAPDGYSVDHTASMILMNPYGEYARRYAHGMTPEDIAADLRTRIAAEPAQ